uniref:Uncharacterized protein n=1 Tax=Hordeum vulgare subsp. vulgare TaxID=112509 RepID=A0A8I6YMI4_HORVV
MNTTEPCVANRARRTISPPHSDDTVMWVARNSPVIRYQARRARGAECGHISVAIRCWCHFALPNGLYRTPIQ